MPAWIVSIFSAILAALMSMLGMGAGGVAPPAPPPVTAPPALPPVAVPPGTPPVADHSMASQTGLFEDLQYLTGAALNTRLDEYAALGVQWARFQVIWASVQRFGPASYDWGPTDALIDGLQQRGIKPLAVLGTSPPWAKRAPGCNVDTCAPTDAAQFGAFAKVTATRYAGRIAAWEVWNEPNMQQFYQPQPDPVGYTALLKSAHSAVKAADPRATVVTGGLAPAITIRNGVGAVRTLHPVDFLQTIYNQGGQGSFDAVGWHPYSYSAMPGGNDGGSAWAQMSTAPVSVRSLMTKYGDSVKKIWATEFGAHTDPIGEGYLTEARHAEYMASGMELWRTHAWAGPMIVYQLRDRGTDVRDRENFFGLQHFDGTPKPAYAAVKARIVKSN